jgi:flagellar secretion chaperone FliS
MLDPTAAYRTTQVTSAAPATRIVLLYEGAIRFGTQHVRALEAGQIEAAHHASIRCQEIVGALRASLDLDAAPVAADLDRIYDYVLERLVAGNLTKTARPTEDALALLRTLLEAWRELAAPSARPSFRSTAVGLAAAGAA